MPQMKSINESITELRNRVIHWQVKGATYFVTWHLHQSQHALAEAERGVIAEAIKHFNKDRHQLFAYVVMDDHVHVVFRLLRDNQLSNVLHSWKSYTANRLQRKFARNGAIWQKDYLEKIVQTEKALLQKMEYVLNNPLKRWPELTEYKWSKWYPIEFIPED